MSSHDSPQPTRTPPKVIPLRRSSSSTRNAASSPSNNNTNLRGAYNPPMLFSTKQQAGVTGGGSSLNSTAVSPSPQRRLRDTSLDKAQFNGAGASGPRYARATSSSAAIGSSGAPKSTSPAKKHATPTRASSCSGRSGTPIGKRHSDGASPPATCSDLRASIVHNTAYYRSTSVTSGAGTASSAGGASSTTVHKLPTLNDNRRSNSAAPRSASPQVHGRSPTPTRSRSVEGAGGATAMPPAEKSRKQSKALRKVKIPAELQSVMDVENISGVGSFDLTLGDSADGSGRTRPGGAVCLEAPLKDVFALTAHNVWCLSKNAVTLVNSTTRQVEATMSRSHDTIAGYFVCAALVENTVWVGTTEGHIYVLDRHTLEQVAPPLARHNGAINQLLYQSPTCSVFSAGVDFTILRWNAETLQVDRCFVGHHGAVKHLAVLDHGWGPLVSYSEDCTIKCWNTVPGANSAKTHHQQQLRSHVDPNDNKGGRFVTEKQPHSSRASGTSTAFSSHPQAQSTRVGGIASGSGAPHKSHDGAEVLHSWRIPHVTALATNHDRYIWLGCQDGSISVIDATGVDSQVTLVRPSGLHPRTNSNPPSPSHRGQRSANAGGGGGSEGKYAISEAAGKGVDIATMQSVRGAMWCTDAQGKIMVYTTDLSGGESDQGKHHLYHDDDIAGFMPPSLDDASATRSVQLEAVCRVQSSALDIVWLMGTQTNTTAAGTSSSTTFVQEMTQCSSVKEGARSKQDNALKLLVSQHQVLESANEELQLRALSLEESMAELRVDSERLKKVIVDRQGSDVDQQIIQDLEASRAKALRTSGDAAEVQRNLRTAEEKVEHLERENTAHKKRIDQLEEEAKMLRLQRSQAEGETGQKEHEIELLKQELDMALAECHSKDQELNDALSSLDERLEEPDEVLALRNEVENLSSALEAASTELTARRLDDRATDRELEVTHLQGRQVGQFLATIDTKMYVAHQSLERAISGVGRVGPGGYQKSVESSFLALGVIRDELKKFGHTQPAVARYLQDVQQQQQQQEEEYDASDQEQQAVVVVEEEGETSAVEEGEHFPILVGDIEPATKLPDVQGGNKPTYTIQQAPEVSVSSLRNKRNSPSPDAAETASDPPVPVEGSSQPANPLHEPSGDAVPTSEQECVVVPASEYLQEY